MSASASWATCGRSTAARDSGGITPRTQSSADPMLGSLQDNDGPTFYNGGTLAGTISALEPTIDMAGSANDFVPIVFHELRGGSLYVP